MTVKCKLLNEAVQISTHTLTWSVTKGRRLESKINLNFNSHAHVERDYLARHKLVVSPNFNSHAHVERDITIF